MARIPEHAEKVFSGEIFDIYQWRQEMFDGSVEIFEAASRNSTVQVIAVTKEGNILLNKEEQPHIGEFISLPGGIVDNEEDPSRAAERELEEETGYKGKESFLWKIEGSSSKLKWETYYYVVKGCEKIKEEEQDKGERISVEEVDMEKFFEKVERESFRNKSFANILYRIRHNISDRQEFEKLLQDKY